LGKRKSKTDWRDIIRPIFDRVVILDEACKEGLMKRVDERNGLTQIRRDLELIMDDGN